MIRGREGGGSAPHRPEVPHLDRKEEGPLCLPSPLEDQDQCQRLEEMEGSR